MPIALRKKRNEKSPGTAGTVTRPRNTKHPDFTNTAAAGNAEAVTHAALLRAGISSIPLKRSKDEKDRKRPAVKSWASFAKSLPTEAQAHAWDCEQARGQAEGKGVICGSVSRLICIDLGSLSCDEGFRKLVEAQAPGLLDRLFQQQTPNGKHYVARFDGPIEGSQKLAMDADNQVLSETRGEGGYFATGKAGYEHIGGPALTELEPITAEELDILLSAARSFDERAAQEYQEPTVPGEAAGKRPGDDFNERASWDDVLLPHGWTRGHNPDTWTRPGKNDGSTSASTATRSKDGVELLCVFSSNAAPLETGVGKSYSKFAAYTVLNHGGDYKAASKALREAGWGDQSSGPPGHIGNGPVSDDGKSLTNCNADGMGYQPMLIAAEHRKQHDDWPRLVCGRLFFHRTGSSAPTYVDTNSQLERMLRNLYSRVSFREGRDRPSMQVLLDEFRAADSETIQYLGIETNPHFPKSINGLYYVVEESLEGGDGARLEQLLDKLNPDTRRDRLLIKAALATLFSDIPGGSRPAFLFAADSHQGSGKSTVAKVASMLLDLSELSFQANEDDNRIKTRLLSAEAMGKRLCTLDNVKSNNFSWAGFEGLLTSRIISGHRMYQGEGDRPNYFTWFITLNAPELSTDIAQRVVTIKLGNLDGEDGVGGSRRSTTWERDILAFVQEHRLAIIADIGALLCGPKVEIQNPSRWATWEGEVLACLPEANELLEVIKDRRQEYDASARDARDLQDYLVAQVTRYGFKLDHESVNVPALTANQWAKETFDGRYREPARTLINRWQRHVPLLRENPSRKHKGACIIVGEKGRPVSYELPRKMSPNARRGA